MNYLVYILRLKDSNEARYVGITTEKLQIRLVKHYHDINREACKNLHKKHWLAKHKGNVIIEQIDTATSWEELTQKEIQYIALYKLQGANLLNVTDGGDGVFGFKKSAESIEKISGINNHRYGTTNTLMVDKYGIKVEAFIDGEWKLFLSITKASKALKVRGSTIQEICEGIYPKNRNRKCKYKFRYLGKEYKERITNTIKEIRPLRNKAIEVLIDNKWKTFNSATIAANILSVQRTKIIGVCQGKRTHTGGYKFRYLSEKIIDNNNLILL
jgi:hypothetical protein